MTLAQEIRAFRDKKGWTQANLAREMGVDANTVARWERGEIKPSGSAVRLFLVLKGGKEEK
jgi:DNA-binding transcriptional regulator YiaG